MTDIEILNEQLDRLYGHDLKGRPQFRVIHTTQVTERRRGIFPFYAGEILTGEAEDEREVEKYTYLDPSWVLERLSLNRTEDVLSEDDFIYEPIWNFTGKAFKDDPTKKPDLWACKFIIRQALFGAKMTKADAIAADDLEKQRYKKFIMENLEERRPDERVQSELGERVYPAVKRFES